MTVIEDVPTVSKNISDQEAKGKLCATFDEAMDLTGFGKFNLVTLFFCGTILLGMILETLGFSYVIPAAHCDLELTLLQKGWLSAIPFICIIMTSHTWGYLADTRGRKKVLIISMALGSTCSILSSLAPNLLTFAILRIFAGAFIACPSSICYAYLGEINPAKHRDKMMILGNSTVTLGTGVVPLIAWAVLPSNFNLPLPYLINGYRPWRLLVALFAMPFVICSITFWLFFPESPKFLHAHGKSDEAMKILKKMYSINSGNDAEDFPVSELQSDDRAKRNPKHSVFRNIWIQTVPLFKMPFLGYTLLTCYLQFVTFAVTNGFYIWFPAVLNKLLNNYEEGAGDSQTLCEVFNRYQNTTKNNSLQIGKEVCDDTLHTETFLYTIVLALGITVAGVAFAFLMKIWNKKFVLMMMFFITGACGFSIYWIHNGMASIAMFSVFQFCGTCIGVINAYVVEIFPTNFRAMAVCITLMIGRVGSVFGTNVIGILMENHCSLNFFLFSGLLFVTILTCFALPVNDKRNEKKIKEASSIETTVDW